MATFIRLPNGDTAVTYKRIPTSTYYDDGTSVLDDYGDIVRDIYDTSWSIIESTVLFSAGSSAVANRPHTSLLGRHIVTCWDEFDPAGGGLGFFLRIDYLAGS